MPDPIRSAAPEKPAAPVAPVKPAPEKPAAPPPDPPDDDDIPAGAAELAATGVGPQSAQDVIAQGFKQIAGAMNPMVMDKELIRATKAQPQGEAPAVPDVGHAIVMDEFRTWRRMIPTVHIMEPIGHVIEVGPAGREIPTGLNYDNVKSGAWKVECFSPHPKELLTVGKAPRQRTFTPAYPFDHEKYKEVDGVFWHPVHAPAKKK